MSDEDELEMYPQKFFDVGEVPKDIDMNSMPTSGLDYLRRVKLELTQCPEVVRVEIDQKKLLQKHPVINVPCTGLTPAPPGFAPPAKWQQEQITEFSNLRREMSMEKPTLQKKLQKKEVPPIKDQEAWHAFCLGSKLADGATAAASTPSAGSSRGGKVSVGRRILRDEPKGAQPLLSSLIWLIQPDIEVLLSYHVEWLQSQGFSDQQGRWIYALMACLEKPLTPNACDILRKLARTCSVLRSKLPNKDDPSLTALNLIICLVANYFDQKDMSDSQGSDFDEIDDIKFDGDDDSDEESDSEASGNESN